MSRLIALILLVMLAPLLAAIWLSVVLSAGRPAMFRQRRSALHGQTFTILKFRSMTDERDARGELLPDDDRTTAIGRLLRRTRLDELPGLINVMRGEMNFVGPRPLLPETITDLGEAGARRGEVKPGLTGWAQVNGNTLLSLQQKVELDLWYTANKNVALDARILLRTIWVMIGGERLSPASSPPAAR